MTNTYINTTVEVDLTGFDAFDMNGNYDTLFVASSGSLVALGPASNGLDLLGGNENATIDGTVYSAQGDGIDELGSGNSTITVNGEVESAEGNGIVTLDPNDIVIVNGFVDAGGADGIALGGSSSTLTVDGSVKGFGNGISDYGNDTVIRIDGSVEGLNTASGQGVLLNDQDQTADIGVKGTVFGATTGLGVAGAGDTVNNSGHISGEIGVFANGSQGFDLINSGEINGVALASATATWIDNSGSVRGNLTIDVASNAAVQNSGIWNGQFDIESSGNTVTNLGSITKGIDFGSEVFSTSSNMVTNDGTIHGGISFDAAYGVRGNDTLTNSGTIYGGVTMSLGDTLVNTGTIHGNVSFATENGNQSSDVFDNSNGIVVGSINGGSSNDTFIIGQGSNTYNPSGISDHFDFGTAFGNDIINGFKTGANHDTITFSGGDFTSFAELQTHMTQVGANTVITLDPGSTIELMHTTIVHLVAADFVFG